ncbi:MAG: stage II sporulation protein P [Candidatus Fimenecus sp.]
MGTRKTLSRRKNNGDAANRVLLTLAVPVLLLCTVFIGMHSTAPLEKAALFSASLALPQGTAEVIKNDFARAAQNGSTSQSASVSVPIENRVQATAATEKPATETDTPADILQMMQEAKAVFAIAEKGGNIVEKQYDAANATDTYENITVRNTTASHSMDIKSVEEKRATLSVTDKSAPTVLIFHTHTTESYELLNYGWYTTDYVTRSNSPDRNMVRVGTAICEELTKMGIGVVHDTEIHDAQYTGAYDRSRESIEKIMAENPSIQVVIDVHRDAIKQSDGTRIKPTAEINGKKAAQIMIIAGCEDGKVTDFPRWEENLTFALQLQKTAETKYPGLMRPILFSARKYNMDVTPCSVLLEMGSDSNTLEEAEYSGHLIGKALGELILQYTKNE